WAETSNATNSPAERDFRCGRKARRLDGSALKTLTKAGYSCPHFWMKKSRLLSSVLCACAMCGSFAGKALTYRHFVPQPLHAPMARGSAGSPRARTPRRRGPSWPRSRARLDQEVHDQNLDGLAVLVQGRAPNLYEALA